MQATLTPRLGRVLAAGALALATAAGWAAPAAQPHRYKVTDLGHVSGVSLNDAGQVVGTRERQGGGFSGFVWDARQGFRQLGTPGGPWVQPAAISNSGVVVGHSYGSGAPAAPFVWSARGGMHVIDLPDSALYGEAVGVNARGTVLLKVRSSSADDIYTWNERDGLRPVLQGDEQQGLGFFPTDIDDSGRILGHHYSPVTPFVRSADGTLTELGTLGGSWAGPSDINNRGWVVGTAGTQPTEVCQGTLCWTEETPHAFLWKPGAGLLDLDAGEPSAHSYAHAVNDAGTVVGLTVGEGAFLWEQGQKTFLNSVLASEGYDIRDARDINARGQILAFDADGRTVLLSPAPEPETVALFLAGLGALAWRTRARQRALAAAAS